MCRPYALRIAKCIAQKDEIARGYIGDGNLRTLCISRGHINRIVRQRRAADRIHIRLDDKMLCRMIVRSNPLCTFQLTVMPLVIVEADRIELIARCMGDRHAGTAVKPSREQDYRFFPHTFPLIRAVRRRLRPCPSRRRCTSPQRGHLPLPSARTPPSPH